jgi:hypothetical protein
LAKKLQWVEIFPTSFGSLFQLRLQFGGSVHLQIRIINCQRAVWRQVDRPIDCLQPLLEKRIVVIDATPALSVGGVANIELRTRIALGRIGAGPLVTRRAKLIATKECQAAVKLFLIDLVDPGSDL